MLNKKYTAPKLGRGLEALLSTSQLGKKGSLLSSGRTIMQLPLDQIDTNPYQPRTHFDEQAINQLANSIRTHGLAQPIVVRRYKNRYQIIAGERRYRASKQCGNETIAAIIRDLSDKEALQIALIENLDRENISPIETAKGYKRLLDEFKLSQQELSKIFTKNRSTISNTLRLLQLPNNIQQYIINNKLSEGHGRALLGTQNELLVKTLAERIILEGLSVRETELLIKNHNLTNATTIKEKNDSQLSLFPELISELSKKYNNQIKINGSRKKGKLVFEYKSEEELNNLLKALQ